jgi:hypothetical protein
MRKLDLSNAVYFYMQVTGKAAERGELTKLVLMVIWNRLDVAQRDVCKALFWVMLPW